MERKRLISVRVDKEALDKVDEYVSKQRWRRRSEIIDAAVCIIAEAIDRGLVEDMIEYYPHLYDITEFSFKCERKRPR